MAVDPQINPYLAMLAGNMVPSPAAAGLPALAGVEMPQPPQIAPPAPAAPLPPVQSIGLPTGNPLMDVDPALAGVATPGAALAPPPAPAPAADAAGGLTGPQSAGLAMLAGQLPQLGGQIGNLISDERAKTSVGDADSALDAFLKAVG